jgi:hypothetical protein
MNYAFRETTKQERVVIANALYPVIYDLEDAERLLDTIQADCFCRNKALSEGEVEWVSSMLRLVENTLSDVITEFHLVTGNYDEPRAASYLAGSERIKAAHKVERLYDKICEREKRLPLDQRETFTETRKKLSEMEDKQALPLLEALAKET